MIISASRRTDIPAYYSEWLINRLKEGYCTVPNPFNSNQISVVDLRPEIVTAIVFWTRNAMPLLKHLDFLDEKGYRYYFQFTINNYPRSYENNNPSLNVALACFEEISNRLGPGKIIWRYDPILFTNDLTLEYHIENFNLLFSNLSRLTRKIVISIVDNYKKTERRVGALNTNYQVDQAEHPSVEVLLRHIAEKANEKAISVESCAEAKNFGFLGIQPGRCVDDKLLKTEFGIDLPYKKDKGQRLACGCIESKDIGMNDTCLMGCEYCYATQSHKKALLNYRKHDPAFSSILVHKIDEDTINKINQITNFDLII